MKVSLVTLGCKLNQFESQAIAESLKKTSFEIVDNIGDSEIVIINTCTVTNKADTKSSRMMKQAKNNGKMVIVTGCYATTDFERLDSLDYVDMVFKNDSKFQIADILARQILHRDTLSRLDTDFPLVTQFEKTRAFIKIQDGCNKFCSYCKIPHARGRSHSLNALIIVDFVERLVNEGYKEIVLSGINISDYDDGNARLYDLLTALLKISGDFRLRLSSLQPDEFDRRIIGLLHNQKLANHFHLSLQSGSRSVLERMERHYDPSFFLDLVEAIRDESPDCGITTDIIVGFPNETEAEFEETLHLVEKSLFSRVHIFPYSPRSHTKASRMTDTPSEIKKERVGRLTAVATDTAKRFAERYCVGKPQTILCETLENGLWNGYSSNYIKIHTAQASSENEFSPVVPQKILIRKGVVEMSD